jgi:hypothetical protein
MFQAPKKPQRPLPPEDTHIARVYQIIDLGTQTDKILDEVKVRRQVRIAFELPNARAVFNEGEEAQPFSIGQDYTWSMHPKSGLRPVVEALRGKFASDAEAEAFNLEEIIGCGAFVTVEHKKPVGGGNTYAKIKQVAKLPRSTETPAGVNKPVTYHTSQGKGGAFGSLPEFIAEKIKKSPEFQEAQ